MLFAVVSRGNNVGTRLLPHRLEDDRYLVSLGRNGPFIPVSDSHDLPNYLANGDSLHTSAKGHKPTPIRPESIRGWEKSSIQFCTL
jgi:hypothetical protein